MSVVIKVLFGEKLYRLAPGTQTLEKVDSEMKQRFPSIRQFRYFYQESEIKELSLIIGQLSRVGSTSLKITAKAEKSDAVELNTSSLSEIKMSEPSQLEASSLVEKSLFEPTEPKFKLPSEFYLCYNCLGKGEIK